MDGIYGRDKPESMAMTDSSTDPDAGGWYRWFIEHLDPGERLGEILFGLIMVLTFTLGVGLEPLGNREESRHLLIAALGCNTAWGVIDAALYLIGRLSERGRIHRLVKRVQAVAHREEALALVTQEVDRSIPPFVGPELRAALGADLLEHAREMKLETNRLTAADA